MPSKVYFEFGIIRAQVAHGHPDAREGKQEIDPALAAQFGRLTGR